MFHDTVNQAKHDMKKSVGAPAPKVTNEAGDADENGKQFHPATKVNGIAIKDPSVAVFYDTVQ